jgi:hypothetical protein
MIKGMIKQSIPYTMLIYDRARRFSKGRTLPVRSLEKLFLKKVGYKLDLENPRSYNEKIQWMKLYWHDPRLTVCMDKYAVREYVESKGLGYILNDIINVYESVDDIDFDSLPNKFVLKANHGSGWNIICTDKSNLDWKSSKWKLKRWMNDNFYYHGYEWGYLGIKPKITCEKFIETTDGKPLKDYKVFCFDGEPKMLFVASDRMNYQTKFDFYTCDWEYIPVKNYYPNSSQKLPRPKELDEVLDISRKLSQGFPHVRIDVYIESGRIIFGEMTFGHFSGLRPFEPQEYDFEFGKYFRLPHKMI